MKILLRNAPWFLLFILGFVILTGALHYDPMTVVAVTLSYSIMNFATRRIK